MSYFFVQRLGYGTSKARFQIARPPQCGESAWFVPDPEDDL